MPQDKTKPTPSVLPTKPEVQLPEGFEGMTQLPGWTPPTPQNRSQLGRSLEGFFSSGGLTPGSAKDAITGLIDLFLTKKQPGQPQQFAGWDQSTNNVAGAIFNTLYAPPLKLFDPKVRTAAANAFVQGIMPPGVSLTGKDGKPMDAGFFSPEGQRGLEWMPVIGPGAQHAREQMEQGDVAGGRGSALGNMFFNTAGITALPEEIVQTGRQLGQAATRATKWMGQEVLHTPQLLGPGQRAAEATSVLDNNLLSGGVNAGQRRAEDLANQASTAAARNVGEARTVQGGINAGHEAEAAQIAADAQRTAITDRLKAVEDERAAWDAEVQRRQQAHAQDVGTAQESAVGETQRRMDEATSETQRREQTFNELVQSQPNPQNILREVNPQPMASGLPETYRSPQPPDTRLPQAYQGTASPPIALEPPVPVQATPVEPPHLPAPEIGPFQPSPAPAVGMSGGSTMFQFDPSRIGLTGPNVEELLKSGRFGGQAIAPDQIPFVKETIEQAMNHPSLTGGRTVSSLEGAGGLQGGSMAGHPAFAGGEITPELVDYAKWLRDQGLGEGGTPTAQTMARAALAKDLQAEISRVIPTTGVSFDALNEMNLPQSALLRTKGAQLGNMNVGQKMLTMGVPLTQRLYNFASGRTKVPGTSLSLAGAGDRAMAEAVRAAILAHLNQGTYTPLSQGK